MIEVIGLTARGWVDLPEPERAVVRRASLVLGSPRLLALVPLEPHQRAAELPRPLRTGLPALLTGVRRVVVLASGDPLVSGIGATLLEEFGVERVRIHPAVSSVALARARMGWSAERSVSLSLVGRPVDRVRRVLSPGARLLLLSSDRRTPAEVAAVLVESGYGDSEVTVLGDLGSDAESRTSAPARDWAQPAPQLNVVCVRCRPEATAPTYGWTAGLPDDAYEHDGQLTKRDVRAVVLSRLAPRPGERLWDLGAGAGSVAIEWCRTDPTCEAIAIERDADRARRIERNAARLGVPELRVVTADTARTDLFEGLAAPDAIFVGGGASPDVLDRAWSALGVGARLVVAAVTVETEQLLHEWSGRLGGELIRVGVEHLQPLGRCHGWVPSRPVVLWSTRKEAT